VRLVLGRQVKTCIGIGAEAGWALGRGTSDHVGVTAAAQGTVIALGRVELGVRIGLGDAWIALFVAIAGVVAGLEADVDGVPAAGLSGAAADLRLSIGAWP
jgi:hypothetical protein